MPEWVLPVAAAAISFGVCVVCVYYLRRASRRMRWSRSSRRWVIRHPDPPVFWAKFAVAAGGALISLGLGLLLLFAHGRVPWEPQPPSKALFEKVEVD